MPNGLDHWPFPHTEDSTTHVCPTTGLSVWWHGLPRFAGRPHFCEQNMAVTRGCISHMACDCHAWGWGTCTLLGSNSRHILLVHVLVLQHDERHWYASMSPGWWLCKVESGYGKVKLNITHQHTNTLQKPINYAIEGWATKVSLHGTRQPFKQCQKNKYIIPQTLTEVSLSPAGFLTSV